MLSPPFLRHFQRKFVITDTVFGFDCPPLTAREYPRFRCPVRSVVRTSGRYDCSIAGRTLSSLSGLQAPTINRTITLRDEVNRHFTRQCHGIWLDDIGASVK